MDNRIAVTPIQLPPSPRLRRTGRLRSRHARSSLASFPPQQGEEKAWLIYAKTSSRDPAQAYLADRREFFRLVLPDVLGLF